MNLFAEGHKNNPRTEEEQAAHDKAQAQAQAKIDENRRQYKEKEEAYIAGRNALRATFDTEEEWQEFLKEEAKENAKDYIGVSGAWIR